MQQTVATFYRFVDLHDCESWKTELKRACNEQKVLGTIILAAEGMNATIAGSKEGVDRVLAFIRADERFSDLDHRECQTKRTTFYRLRIIIRPEIVTLGDSTVNPNKGRGKYVSPEDWNRLISNPEVLVVDARNNYEVEMGTFEGAINPQTSTFREWKSFAKSHLPKNGQRKVAMFCTGGIRCEKASAHLLSEGFEEVYHLQGGILNYLQGVQPEDSLWEGECFVFDHRVSVVHGLKEGQSIICYGCRMPLEKENLDSPNYEEGVCCLRCYMNLDEETRASRRERHQQQALAMARGEKHIGQHFDLVEKNLTEGNAKS